MGSPAFKPRLELLANAGSAGFESLRCYGRASGAMEWLAAWLAGRLQMDHLGCPGLWPRASTHVVDARPASLKGVGIAVDDHS